MCFCSDMNAGRGRRDGIVTAAASTTSPAGERKQPSISRQSASVEEEEPTKETKIPSPERLEELQSEFENYISLR